MVVSLEIYTQAIIIKNSEQKTAIKESGQWALLFRSSLVTHIAQWSCAYFVNKLLLELSLDRFNNLQIFVNERICYLCNLNETEDEIHFLLRCTCYNDLRLLFTRKH